MAAADALAWVLRALGVARQDIPPQPGERAALYRSVLARRRILVVLDNAGSSEQVRPLLPGAPACGVLVTSRDSLAGLVARDGAARLDLDLLSMADAVALLRALIGRRVDADPAAAEVLASQCSRLPLALRVAAELATAHPQHVPGRPGRELADQQLRLDLLDADGDPRAGVRAVFSWSYRNLVAGAARASGCWACTPAPTSTVTQPPRSPAPPSGRSARCWTCSPGRTLIQQAGPDRYNMHDLLRAYARDLAATEDSEEEGRRRLTRLFDHYLHTAGAAMDLLYPAEATRGPESSRQPR